MIKINARDCVLKDVSREDELKFLEINHSQGATKSSIVCYGLYYNGELVQLMSLGTPRFFKSKNGKIYQWEIHRECTKKNYSVRGGASKLWKHFLKNNRCHSCICYHYPHDEETLYTSHLVDNCGFKCIKKAKSEKKIHYEGMWDGEFKRIDKSILEIHGVDRLLNTSQGFDRTNRQIMLDLGFEEIVEDGLSPQIDIYYPFGVLYRIDDLTDGSFYIGMCEVEETWNNGYMGSGGRWKSHMDKHQDHEYKRTVLKDDFKTPKDLRRAELEEIKKYCFFKDGTYIVDSTTGCKNVELRTQGQPHIIPKCNICGYQNGTHSKECPRYKSDLTCEECGGISGHHKSTCSKCSRTTKICEECGGVGGKHKKSCSRYVDAKPCPECGRKYGHKKGCMYYKPSEVTCPECGGKAGKHRIGCSEYNDRGTCSECGGRDGKHTSSCSKYKRPICPECGGVGRHYKTCSKYNELSKCSECGGKNGHHYKSCSKFKTRHVCLECGGKNGHHKKGCSLIAARATNRD